MSRREYRDKPRPLVRTRLNVLADFLAACDAAGIDPASRDRMARMLIDRMVPPARDPEPVPERGKGWFLEYIERED